MKKNILILNSEHNIEKLFDFLNILPTLNNNCTFKTYNSNLIKRFQDNSCVVVKIRKKEIHKVNFLYNFLILIFYPLSIIKNTVYLLYQKIKNKTNSIIMFGWCEKIMLTIPAKILKIKTIWIECPEVEYVKFSKILKFLYRLNSKKTKIIILNTVSGKKLKEIGIKNFKLILPGLKLNLFERQDNIFNQIVENKHNNHNHKYFTIGTMADLNNMHNIEILFSSIKKCISVIPNLQLIVVGDGIERKQMQWLSNKLGIGNIVWFIGEQNQLRKWLENINIYTSISKKISLTDFINTLSVQSHSVPVIAFKEIGFEDIITHNTNGILIEENSDILTSEIINLYKNKKFTSMLAKNAKDYIDKNHNIDIMTKKIIDELNK